MRRFDHAVAEDRLAGLGLSPANRRLAGYWLSLWEGNNLPRRADFAPGMVRDLLPGIMIQEIQPGRRVTVRLCGTAINQAFGLDLTGRDLIALSSEETRVRRLEHHTRVAEGAIGFTLRRAATRFGFPADSEELHLPFADLTADGARLVLFHSDWRGRTAHPGTAEVPDVLTSQVEIRILPLWNG